MKRPVIRLARRNVYFVGRVQKRSEVWVLSFCTLKMVAIVSSLTFIFRHQYRIYIDTCQKSIISLATDLCISNLTYCPFVRFLWSCGFKCPTTWCNGGIMAKFYVRGRIRDGVVIMHEESFSGLVGKN